MADSKQIQINLYGPNAQGMAFGLSGAMRNQGLTTQVVEGLSHTANINLNSMNADQGMRDWAARIRTTTDIDDIRVNAELQQSKIQAARDSGAQVVIVAETPTALLWNLRDSPEIDALVAEYQQRDTGDYNFVPMPWTDRENVIKWRRFLDSYGIKYPVNPLSNFNERDIVRILADEVRKLRTTPAEVVRPVIENVITPDDWEEIVTKVVHNEKKRDAYIAGADSAAKLNEQRKQELPRVGRTVELKDMIGAALPKDIDQAFDETRVSVAPERAAVLEEKDELGEEYFIEDGSAPVEAVDSFMSEVVAADDISNAAPVKTVDTARMTDDWDWDNIDLPGIPVEPVEHSEAWKAKNGELEKQRNYFDQNLVKIKRDDNYVHLFIPKQYIVKIGEVKHVRKTGKPYHKALYSLPPETRVGNHDLSGCMFDGFAQPLFVDLLKKSIATVDAKTGKQNPLGIDVSIKPNDRVEVFHYDDKNNRVTDGFFKPLDLARAVERRKGRWQAVERSMDLSRETAKWVQDKRDDIPVAPVKSNGEVGES